MPILCLSLWWTICRFFSHKFLNLDICSVIAFHWNLVLTHWFLPTCLSYTTPSKSVLSGLRVPHKYVGWPRSSLCVRCFLVCLAVTVSVPFCCSLLLFLKCSFLALMLVHSEHCNRVPLFMARSIISRLCVKCSSHVESMFLFVCPCLCSVIVFCYVLPVYLITVAWTISAQNKLFFSPFFFTGDFSCGHNQSAGCFWICWLACCPSVRNATCFSSCFSRSVLLIAQWWV